MCFLADVGLRAHELAHRTRLFARVCSRELKGFRVSRACAPAHLCARVHACVCSRALKEFAIPRESLCALKGIRVPEDPKFTCIIYIYIYILGLLALGP